MRHFILMFRCANRTHVFCDLRNRKDRSYLVLLHTNYCALFRIDLENVY